MVGLGAPSPYHQLLQYGCFTSLKSLSSVQRYCKIFWKSFSHGSNIGLFLHDVFCSWEIKQHFQQELRKMAVAGCIQVFEKNNLGENMHSSKQKYIVELLECSLWVLRDYVQVRYFNLICYKRWKKLINDRLETKMVTLSYDEMTSYLLLSLSSNRNIFLNLSIKSVNLCMFMVTSCMWQSPIECGQHCPFAWLK